MHLSINRRMSVSDENLFALIDFVEAMDSKRTHTPEDHSFSLAAKSTDENFEFQQYSTCSKLGFYTIPSHDWVGLRRVLIRIHWRENNQTLCRGKSISKNELRTDFLKQQW